MIRVKEPKFGKLQMVCVEALGDGNQVWPFGSSANGCGEAGSDLDMLVSAKEKKTSKGKAVNALRKVADVGIMALKWRTFDHGPRCRS